MHTVYDVNDGTEYHFAATDPLDAMKKMLYTLNLSKHDAGAQIVKTACGYLLAHNNNEFWTNMQVSGGAL